MAVEAMNAGLSNKDVAEVIDAAPTTISAWHRTWRTKGLDGFVHAGGNPR